MTKQNRLLDADGTVFTWDENSLEKLAQMCTSENLEISLPQLPTDFLEWNYICRPTILGKKNRLKFLPMWQAIYKDEHPFIALLIARQWGKTTYLASRLAFDATTQSYTVVVYITYEEEALRMFSNDKFRKAVFSQYPLSDYVAGSKFGSLSFMELKNNSIIHMITDAHGFLHAQGKSSKKNVIDEWQEIDLTGYYNLRETQADTMGDTIFAGIGGYVDSAQHKMWKTTNQMKYQFKRGEPYKGYTNMSWRADLEYNSEGLVWDHYLLDVLDGLWEAQDPKNFMRHGYWLPQTYHPGIPLTIQDAIEKYKVSPEFSIEFKQKDPEYTHSEFLRNVMAEFVEGELKPITEKMMLALFDKNAGLIKSADVDHEKGKIYIGIDWGGGGKTIVWIWQCLDDTIPLFRLLWVERIETDDVESQYEFCKNLIDAYEGDFIVIDAGGGTYQVQKLQMRYGRRCIRNSYMARPEKPKPTREEIIKLRKEMRYMIDRTYSIDRIIDLIKRPYADGARTVNRIIIPGDEEAWEKIKWVVQQFVALEGEKATLKSTGQQFTRYIHKDTEPDDALHACNYAHIAWDIGRGERKGHIIGGPFDNKPDSSSVDSLLDRSYRNTRNASDFGENYRL